MAIDSIENVNEYHAAIASLITTTVSTIVNKQKEQSRELMEWIIRFSYTQYRENKDPDLPIESLIKDIEDMQLKNKSLEELTIYMSYYQAKAKMKSVQQSDGKAKLWQKLRGRL